jgi:hypothetical protein
VGGVIVDATPTDYQLAIQEHRIEVVVLYPTGAVVTLIRVPSLTAHPVF